MPGRRQHQPASHHGTTKASTHLRQPPKEESEPARRRRTLWPLLGPPPHPPPAAARLPARPQAVTLHREAAGAGQPLGGRPAPPPPAAAAHHHGEANEGGGGGRLSVSSARAPPRGVRLLCPATRRPEPAARPPPQLPARPASRAPGRRNFLSLVFLPGLVSLWDTHLLSPSLSAVGVGVGAAAPGGPSSALTGRPPPALRLHGRWGRFLAARSRRRAPPRARGYDAAFVPACPSWVLWS